MSRRLLASFGSACLGGVLGAAAAVWWLSDGAPERAPRAEPSRSPEPPAAGDAALERRLAALERAVSSIGDSLRTARSARPPPSGAPAADPGASAAHPIDTPVFEAAVIDIIERAEDERDRERAAEREDKRRQRAMRWASGLGAQLDLSAAQTQALLDIQAELDQALERERERASAPGAIVSKEERREARRALREEADGRLRALLSSPQREAYDALDERWKLYRPKDAD